MVTERPPVGTRCFGLGEIRSGRALAIVGSGPTVTGLVPDGVQ
jgi:hypothetical protein